MYRAVTRNIQVTVSPTFLEAESSPEDDRFFWAYTVEIVNLGSETVQLKTRYWQITDAHGRVQEVRGEGVVGKTPLLRPGERFEYTSGCPLATPEGIMAGHYHMVTSDGEAFAVTVPAFSLDSPHSHNKAVH
jgi:ApaG protein